MQTNTLAAALIAGYLGLVLIRGNEKKLAELLLNEAGFIRWFIALSIVLAVSDKLGDAGTALIWLVYAAMLLQAIKQNPKIFNDLSAPLEAK